MGTIFFTGFPGFLGRELLPRVLARRSADRAVCLVQPKFRAMAEQSARELAARDPSLEGRIAIVPGDLVQPDLGLGEGRAALARDVVEIYHLAAVYDLDVPRDLAFRVNVEGTRHLLDFARGCAGLERHHYVSTCYVSGRHEGLFREVDLERGQTFGNFYEETKYLAEVEVARARDAGMPTTIYRPSIVVGDHRTGATQKFDGPYFIIKWLLRQPRFAIMPVIGDPTAYRFNVVPRDYVVNAIAHLSGIDASRGKTYQLCAPEPLNVDDTLRTIAQAVDRRLVRVPVTSGLAVSALGIPRLKALVGIPAKSIPYFAHPTDYGCEQTLADLEGTGIRCPRFDEYVGALVSFVRAHPEVGSAAMV